MWKLASIYATVTSLGIVYTELQLTTAGDVGQAHFIQPKSSLVMVDFSNAILQRCKGSIDYIHMPVPKDRTDTSFYQPLEQLRLRNTELILGIAHHDDLLGTKARVSAAGEFVKSFAVATECGLGRMPPEQLDNILKILADVSTSTKL